MQPTLTGMLALLLASVAAAGAAGESPSPLGQVLSLLDGLKAKIAKEGVEEETAFKAFVAWCDDAVATKTAEIKAATTKKEQLTAAISKAAASAETASAKIEELVASISANEADLKSARAVRAKETADFLSNEAELMDVVSTIGRATAVIQREMAKRPAAFAQLDTSNAEQIIKSLGAVVDAAALPSADKQKLMATIQEQQKADDEDMGAPAAAAYKSRSGGILDVLEDMKEKAEEQLGELRKAEVNAKHNYDMLKQSLEEQNDADKQDLAEQRSALAAAQEAKAIAEGDLAATVKDLADAKAALEVAQTSCMTAAQDHEASTKARAEELAAITKARAVLEESTAAGDHAYSFLQQEDQAGAHLRTRADLANAEVVNLIKRLAKEQHSSALTQLATRVSAILHGAAGAGEDPYAKVKGLITDLIARLQEEQKAEAVEKAYCDEQMAKTEEKKAGLEYRVSKLTAKIDQSLAKSAKLKEEIQTLQSELATLAKEQANMDKLRRDGKAAYEQAKSDLELGLGGVRKALSVLREYYGGSEEAAMVQQGTGIADAMQQPALPTYHAKSSGAGSNIIGLLEVVESDFAKSLATEEAAEDDAQTEYQKVTWTNKISTDLKNKDVQHKTAEVKALDKAVAELTADRESADAELSAVLDYYAKIKERCIAKPMTYEERKARRDAEIRGLKEALTILEDESSFVQRKKKGGLRGAQLRAD